MKKLVIVLCLLTMPVMAQSNQEMLQYLVQQDMQRQQQVQQIPQPVYGRTIQQWETCMRNAWTRGQLAPKHTGATLLEGNAQALEFQQACGPRPQ